jgi:hypothetical protein
VFALGGRGARCREVLEAIGRIEAVALASPVVDAVIGLCADPEDPRIGRIDSSAADDLGIDGVTILAVRPDRYVGFRHDGADAGLLMGYLDAFTN